VSARMFYIIKDGDRAWIIKIHHSGVARDLAVTGSSSTPKPN
jgi:hypothetical protein